jgi:hypothetical protein
MYVQPSNIEYGECVTVILDALFEIAGYCDHVISNMHFKKLHKMTKKSRNFKYEVLEKPVNSNIRRRSDRNFKYLLVWVQKLLLAASLGYASGDTFLIQFVLRKSITY